MSERTQTKREARLRWSQEEDAVLREKYPLYGKDVIKFLPQRNKSACFIRASKLGLRRNQGWTESEDTLLREFYDPHNLAPLLEKLPWRSVTACQKRAKKLGLNMYRRHWTPQEDAILCEEFPQKGICCAPSLPNRSRQAIYYRARLLKLSPGKKRRWTEEEIHILRENYQTLGYSTASLLENRNGASCASMALRLGIKKDLGMIQKKKKVPDDTELPVAQDVPADVADKTETSPTEEAPQEEDASDPSNLPCPPRPPTPSDINFTEGG